jgi:hypothetical protein
MTSSAYTIPSLERPVFFDGQLLAATDLSAIFDYHREMRWLHNRTLHGWGIALGMKVDGDAGDRTVTVTPGYALDCAGHDLVLAARSVLQVPPVAGAAGGGAAFYYLTASYLTDAQLSPSETETGECERSGAVRLTEAPLLRWQDPKNVSVPDLRYRRGLDIVLASVWVKNCKISKAISTADRRDLHAASEPYLVGGSTPSGSTPWAAWPSAGSMEGVRTTVDTSAAGFVTTPTYTAQVNGTRLIAPNILIDGPASVSAAKPASFTVTVLLPRNLNVGAFTLNPDSAIGPKLLHQLKLGSGLGWYVSWMGVEG